MTFTVRYRCPIAIVGGAEPTDAQYSTAFAIALALADKGWPIICGGRSGVMRAAAEGVKEGGGICLGILPEMDASTAQRSSATIVIATDLGNQSTPISRVPSATKPRDVSRNRIIVGSALCVVAVGGGAGTANEIKLALQFGKTVVQVGGAPGPEGIDENSEPPLKGTLVVVDSPEAVLEEVEKVVRATARSWLL